METTNMTIRVVLIPGQAPPEVIDVEPKFKGPNGMYAALGCEFIEAVSIDAHTMAYFDADAKGANRYPNMLATLLAQEAGRIAVTDMIAGPVLLVGNDSDSEESDAGAEWVEWATAHAKMMATKESDS
jgi:hypothetical protein